MARSIMRGSMGEFPNTDPYCIYRLLPFYVQDAIRKNGLGGGVDKGIWKEAPGGVDAKKIGALRAPGGGGRY